MEIENLTAYREDWQPKPPRIPMMNKPEVEEWYRQNPARRYARLSVDGVTEVPLILDAEGECKVIGTAVVSIKDGEITTVSSKIDSDHPVLKMEPTGMSLGFADKERDEPQ